jgi:hypothetical protein
MLERVAILSFKKQSTIGTQPCKIGLKSHCLVLSFETESFHCIFFQAEFSIGSWRKLLDPGTLFLIANLAKRTARASS